MPKIEKQAAGYVHFEGTDYHCEECYKFEPRLPNGNAGGFKQDCAEVAGTIKPIGGCNTFVKGEQSQVVGITLPRKLSQLEAGYTENKAGFSCKRCEYFLRDRWDCQKVDKNSKGADDGFIHPDACCNNWEKDKVFGVIQ